MDELKKFINIKNTLDVLYTILIYNKSVSSILNDIEEQRIKAKNISNPVKKHKIMERLFLFENYFPPSPTGLPTRSIAQRKPR